MTSVPERMVRGDLVIRRWRLTDAVPLATAIAESLDHLRPWMSWAAAEPLPMQERHAIMVRWERSWEVGDELAYGLFLHRRVVGGCGLMRRRGGRPGPRPADEATTAHVDRPHRQVTGGIGGIGGIGGTLEIGYWVHVDHVGKGYATAAAVALTDTAFSMAGIERVEIHHDVANVASGRVPAKLGYRVVGDEPGEAGAPGETGTRRIWRTTRAEWAGRARH